MKGTTILETIAWPLAALKYVKNLIITIAEQSNNLKEDLRNDQKSHDESWHISCKDIILTLDDVLDSFNGISEFPNENFASPDMFEQALNQLQARVAKMADELDKEAEKYQTANKVAGPPFLVRQTREYVARVSAGINYVQSQKLHIPATSSVDADIDLIVRLSQRFHEAVLSLRKHPHKGKVYTVSNEWDCQYIFRSILAAYIADIRDEEWSPSFAGSSARCEFFLKSLKLMIELKFVRQATDARKIKTEFATDLLDYGKNPQVNHVILLVYDPNSVLQNAVALEEDFSGPTSDLSRVDVVISPQRR